MYWVIWIPLSIIKMLTDIWDIHRKDCTKTESILSASGMLWVSWLKLGFQWDDARIIMQL